MTRREAAGVAGWGALIVILLFGVGALWQNIGYEAFVVEGPSMLPTLGPDDRFILERGAYGSGARLWAEPAVGDVVVAQSPVDDSIVVKRIAAVGGDTIASRQGVLRINGQQVRLGPDRPCRFGDAASGCRLREESFRHNESHESAWGRLGDFGPVHVSPGSVFLIGDHRDRSNDSRNPLMGPVANERILGRVGWTY